jgi:hypothetical protein
LRGDSAKSSENAAERRADLFIGAGFLLLCAGSARMQNWKAET